MADKLKVSRRRGKLSTVRIPTDKPGAERSVETRLREYQQQSSAQLAEMQEICTQMSERLQQERERIRDHSPTRKKQDQLIGSLKHSSDRLGRELGRFRNEQQLHSVELLREYELEKTHILIEQEHRGKIGMHWLNSSGLVTTPHQRRVSAASVKLEQNAVEVVQFCKP
jgi:hypothetical protein